MTSLGMWLISNCFQASLSFGVAPRFHRNVLVGVFGAIDTCLALLPLSLASSLTPVDPDLAFCPCLRSESLLSPVRENDHVMFRVVEVCITGLSDMEQLVLSRG